MENDSPRRHRGHGGRQGEERRAGEKTNRRGAETQKNGERKRRRRERRKSRNGRETKSIRVIVFSKPTVSRRWGIRMRIVRFSSRLSP
jgi:hypothetical protein